MNKPVIVGIGELLWDLLPSGKQLGGAPANFVYHAGILGAEAYTVSAIGNDETGYEILNLLEHLNLTKKYVSIDEEHPTGTVSVSLDKEGIPAYNIHEDVAWDFIPMDDELMDLAKKTDAVCFGSLAQRSPVSRKSISNFLYNLKKECLKVFDINLRQKFYSKELIASSLELSDILKLNEDELKIISQLFSLHGTERALLHQILEAFDLQLIALTKGAKGSVLYSSNQNSVLEVPAIKIVDTVGAGDAFTAVLIMGLLNGHPLRSIHEHANRIAGYVCGKAGAMPLMEPDLVKTFDNPYEINIL